MNFNETKQKFEEGRSKEDGFKIMQKATELINEVGQNFLELDGGTLYNIRTKLTGYKFHLADYTHEMSRMSSALKIELRNIRADNWDSITEEIKAKEGKVKNKEQIENKLEVKTKVLQQEQILYETLYYKYKLKLSSIDDVLMAITQRIKELQKELEQSKY